jgi:glutamate synthase domain-containing protein 3
LIASDGGQSEFFASSVAISGDTVVIGAPSDDIGSTLSQGSAYVYFRSGSVWTEQAKLTASDGAASDLFGTGVGISGDTVIVGAFWDNVGPNTDQGSAYIFTRSGSVWTQQQKLTASDGAANDALGFAVAISGDIAIATAGGAARRGIRKGSDRARCLL